MVGAHTRARASTRVDPRSLPLPHKSGQQPPPAVCVCHCRSRVYLVLRLASQVVQQLGLLPPAAAPAPPMGPEGYGAGMCRSEVPAGWAAELLRRAGAGGGGGGGGSGGGGVVVVPVINVEVFVPGAGGPGVQPHLASMPEIANSGWRDYGNRAGARRAVSGTFLPASAR